MFGTNIFSKRCDVILASSIVPEFTISPNPVDCSITSKAPVLLSERFFIATTISLTISSLSS